MHTDRNAHLDTLAKGSRCPKCHAEADETCRTARTGAATLPHLARIDRAVAQYQAARS